MGADPPSFGVVDAHTVTDNGEETSRKGYDGKDDGSSEDAEPG